MKKGLRATSPRFSMTLREEASGKKKQGNVNAKTRCKLHHLQNLAVWSAVDASIPSLAAFFGERFAATNEALALRSDPSLFLCQRCESILQPGDNCTVRIEKNKSKMRRRRMKPNLTSQNNVVYMCHFCSHRNLMRGTPNGYVKETCPPKTKVKLKLVHFKSEVEKSHNIAKATRSTNEINTMDIFASPIIESSCPTSPLPTIGLSLLDSKRRKRNRSSAKKVAERETSSNAADAEKCTTHHASGKRRKKSWTSLKEIAQSSRHDTAKKLTDLTISFFL